MSNNVFTPVVDAEEVYGEGDWRSLLSDKQRKNNWRLYMIGKQSIDHQLRGVILPSFDFTLSLDDQSFPTSVADCWTTTPDKRLPRHFVPNAFALPILMYPYLGEKKEHWISPWNRRNMIGNDTTDPEEFADAFDDLNKWVRRNKQISEDNKNMLLKAESMKEDAPIPGRTIRYFSQAECIEKDNPDWHLGLVGYTASSYAYLLEQMRWAHQDDTEPRDSNFPRYMLGDPTNPKAALQFHCDKIAIDAKDPYETNVMCYTKRREYLDDPVETHAVSEEVLSKRFLLPDPANWNIPTYEEQVMHMIEHFDSRVTIEMIRAACEHRYRGEMPTARPKSVSYSEPLPAAAAPKATAREEVPVPAASVAPAPAPAAPLAPTSAAPAMPAPEVSYWVGAPGGKPSKMTVSELQAACDSGAADGFKVNIDGEWKLVEDSGIVTVAVKQEVPVSVPVEEAPPSVPVDAAPPSVPTDDAPAASGEVTRDDLKAKLFPDTDAFAAMSPEKQAEAEKLVDDAYKATDSGRHMEMPEDVVERLLTLIG